MPKALAPEISTWPAPDPQLVGSRCSDCGAVAFPVHSRCPRCSSGNVAETTLPRRGTLVSWTTQGFLPGPPYAGRETAETFTPFGVGLVQLGDVVRVEGRLTENDPDRLAFGMEVELTMVPIAVGDDGTETVTFAFRTI